MSKRRHVISTLAIILIIAGVLLVLNEHVSEVRIAKLKEEVQSPSTQNSTIDWDALKNQNPDVCGWLKVTGTSIDTPVVKPSAADMQYYLNHDFWGGWSQSGCAFMDFRADPNTGSQLIYGHHINWSTLAFSELYDCWEQERFDELENCIWSTEEQCGLQLKPLCALVVHETDERVQDVEQTSIEDIRKNALLLAVDASAQAPDYEELIAQSHRCVKLVTCSALTPGQPWRCCVVFVDGN